MSKVNKIEQLIIPRPLKNEFATVLAVLDVPDVKSDTQNLDALILSWVKYEKQIRKLFSFLVYQHEIVTINNWKKVEKAISVNRELRPDILIREIRGLTNNCVFRKLRRKHRALSEDIERLRSRRNKLLHGHVTALGLDGATLSDYVKKVITWMDLIAQTAEAEHGYNGLERDTFCLAKKRNKAIANDKFQTLEELMEWIGTIEQKPQNGYRTLLQWFKTKINSLS